MFGRKLSKRIERLEHDVAELGKSMFRCWICGEMRRRTDKEPAAQVTPGPKEPSTWPREDGSVGPTWPWAICQFCASQIVRQVNGGKEAAP